MFYNRLKAACDLRNIAVSRAVKEALPSTGVIDNWKKGGTANAEAIVKLASYLRVSCDYLLETSSNPEISSENARELSADEAEVIDLLRHADPKTRGDVMIMAKAVLHSSSTLSFSSDDSNINRPAGGAKKVEGTAAAGTPITAMPEDEASVPVPRKYLESRFFVVRAAGESMIGAGIPDGAHCVFNSEGHVDDGRIVLAQVEGPTDQPEVTIKRVYRHGAEIELRPENPAFDAMFYPAGAVRITGVLVDVLPPEA